MAVKAAAHVTKLKTNNPQRKCIKIFLMSGNRFFGKGNAIRIKSKTNIMIFYFLYEAWLRNALPILHNDLMVYFLA